MSREVEKTLDSIGVSHLWKRMVEYVNGVMPKKTTDLVNDAGFITDFSELPPDQREALRGPRGLQGNQGDQGNPGEPGRGIESIRKTSSSGLTDTYTVTFTDGSSYQYNVVNGKDGADASTQGISYNDLNDKPTIPANLSELQDDTGHRTVSDTEKATWSNKSDFSGNYNDLSEAPDFKTINGESIIGTGDIVIQGGGGTQIQSDWDQSDSTKVDYIKNKPDVYEKPSTGIPPTDLSSAVQTSLGKADTALQEQVKANWNETNTSSAAYIQNKPSHLVSTDSYDGTGVVVPSDAQRLSSMMGYYECNTSGSTAAKVVDASGYVLSNGGSIRIKMTNANTADNVTLNINSTGAKALYYDGAQASSTNTWEAGEVLEVYYDGTQYQCASGGGVLSELKGANPYESDLSFCDGNGYSIVDFIDGHVRTKNFNSAGIGSIINKYAGKKVSILGDSISTYGVPGSTNQDGTYCYSYYPTATCRYSQNGSDSITFNVADTYWMRLINQMGAVLGINESWRGTKVAGSDASAFNNQTRINHLGENGTPDLILVFGGTNDAGNNITIGTFNGGVYTDYDTAEEIAALPVSTFADAYKAMLIRLMFTYPTSEIVCILPTYTTTYYTIQKLDDYVEVIKEACDFFGIKWIDTRVSGINIYNKASFLVDGIHPNAAGMKLIADNIYKHLIFG